MITEYKAFTDKSCS